MILDGRKNYQYEYSALIAKRIYAQKLARDKYAVGINGTSLHLPRSSSYILPLPPSLFFRLRGSVIRVFYLRVHLQNLRSVGLHVLVSRLLTVQSIVFFCSSFFLVFVGSYAFGLPLLTLFSSPLNIFCNI